MTDDSTQTPATKAANATSESPADGHVIVGAQIHLREGAALLCDSVDMADTRELEAALKVSRKAFEAARDKIAKRTQVSGAVLKVMAGIHSDSLKLSIVIERRYMSNELMDEFGKRGLTTLYPLTGTGGMLA